MKGEAWNIEFAYFKFFPGFELKFQVFTTFGANSKHFRGLEKKMTKFQVFQVGWEPCETIWSHRSVKTLSHCGHIFYLHIGAVLANTTRLLELLWHLPISIPNCLSNLRKHLRSEPISIFFSHLLKSASCPMKFVMPGSVLKPTGNSQTGSTVPYLTTYSPWSAMNELSLLLNYQVYRWKGTSSFLQL